MKVSVEKAGPCRTMMTIDVPPEAVVGDYESLLATYTKAARLPGFRKGKAPSNIVERQFQKRIEEDARERLVPKFYNEALKKEGIEPVAIVGVDRMTFGKKDGLHFEVTLDIAPSFKLPKYQKIPVAATTIDVTDTDVDTHLERLRERMARFEDAGQRGARKGDLVCIDFEGSCDGVPLSDIVPDSPGLCKAADFWALLDDPGFLPGLTGRLEGATTGEKRTVEIVFPSDHHPAALAGRRTVYDIVVKTIRERILPNIDQEFLKQLGEDSEESLRKKIREQLEEHARQREKTHVRGEIGNYLVSKTEFDMPRSVVEQEIRLMARTLVQQIAARGATREQIEEQKEVILSEATRSSNERVKLRYILSRIAEEEHIHCEDSELETRIGAMAAQYRMSPVQLRSELEKRDGIESVRSDIRMDKTMDFLEAHANVK